ncbi:MAG: hypothetical protein COA73_09270 [Candidatus Hydrogenedentota bacterium]|nr:MAG: hypothetical protein COA73_09270 [Candidatus Hydrogenedentota bacterium]
MVHHDMSSQKCLKCGHKEEAGAILCTRCGSPFEIKVPDTGSVSNIRRGQVIAKRYAVQDVVGRGGMGCIYKVYDNTLGEVVALKTLLPEFVKDNMVRDRFFNEARIARQLSHPNIVRVHDIGTAEDGIVYISMEMLPGRSLRSLLDKLKPGQRLPVNAILRMFDALCAALDYAHKYTIHRDIKPENVMVLPDGSIKLMDFGISKLMSNPSMTSASMVMGTPHYMSPEQLKNTSKVDVRADIYSVGVMLYEVLTGHTPTGVPRTASDTTRDVPASLDPIIAKCLNPSPDKRYSSAAELREALREIRIKLETGATPRSLDETPPPVVSPGKVNPKAGLSRKAVTFMLIMMVVAGAAYGIKAAEERRTTMIHPETGSVENGLPVVNPGSENVETTALMLRLVDRAHTSAFNVVDKFPEDEGDPVLGDLYSEGNSFWTLAQSEEETDEAKTMEAGWKALHRFLAIAYWPQGMAFVPEGSGESTPAFLIDTHEVTVGAFADFTRSDTGWRWPREVDATMRDQPMTYVTYYDALAFAAHGEPSRRLPTSSHWIRAMSAGVDEEGVLRWNAMADSSSKAVHAYGARLFEWTCTLDSGEQSTPGFYDEMIIVGGSFDTMDSFVPGSTRKLLYQNFAPHVGFRCVLAMPSTLEEANRILEQGGF